MNYKVKKLLFFDAIAPYEYNFNILNEIKMHGLYFYYN